MNRDHQATLRVLGFAFWLTLSTLAATTLTAWHSVSLQVHSTITNAPNSHLRQWHLTHYLSPDCDCSRAVGRHLAARGPSVVATEEVILIDSRGISAKSSLTAELSQSGFHVTTLSPEAAVAQEGVEGVPIFKIQAPDGTIRFRGGYRDQTTPSGQFLDINILSAVMASKTMTAPRAYGCATGRRLRSLLDPLSIQSLSF